MTFNKIDKPAMFLFAVAAVALLAALARSAGPAVAQGTGQEQEVIIGIEGNAQKVNLVLEEFAAIGGATNTDAKRVREVVNNDLSITDFFNIVSAPAGTALGTPPDTSGWYAIVPATGGPVGLRGGTFPGARVIAGAKISLVSGDLVVEGYLKEYPSYRGIMTRTYRARPEWFREAAHRFSDDIVLYLTGEEGISRTRIAFISTQTGAKELHLIDFDGENVRQITRDKSIALSPAWNGNGSRIAFVSFRKGDPDLYQVNLSSGEISSLASRPGPDMAPAFSRDGSKIAYTATVKGNSEIMVAGADGRNARQITNNRGIDTAPCWSSTGNEICFTSDRAGNPQLYVSDSSGGNLRRLTHSGNWNDSPDWSPDGQRIVYVSQSGKGFRVWTMMADGSNATAITGGGGSDENPKWSPDGRKIVFSSTREGRRALYTMNLDGSGVRRLTFLKGDCYGTSWSPRPPR